jgi:hypothetical protein
LTSGNKSRCSGANRDEWKDNRKPTVIIAIGSATMKMDRTDGPLEQVDLE